MMMSFRCAALNSPALSSRSPKVSLCFASRQTLRLLFRVEFLRHRGFCDGTSGYCLNCFLQSQLSRLSQHDQGQCGSSHSKQKFTQQTEADYDQILHRVVVIITIYIASSKQLANGPPCSCLPCCAKISN